MARLAHGSGVLEKLPLYVCRQVIPLHNHRRPEALQDMLLIFCERCSFVAIVSRCWPGRTSLALPPGKGSCQLVARIPVL